MQQAVHALSVVAKGQDSAAAVRAARDAAAELATVDVTVQMLLSNGAGKLVRQLGLRTRVRREMPERMGLRRLEGFVFVIASELQHSLLLITKPPHSPVP